MCGITGSFAFSAEEALQIDKLHKALTAIGHRGPDNQGTYSDKHIVLGHSRLSIIDISDKGNQPMTDNTGRFVLIYNGECYNHQALRKKLAGKGISFRSESDTETLLYWLREYGPEGLVDVNGFFSLAFYDKVNKKLLLARDRFGIKPLYYSIRGKDVSFSSEINGLIPYLGKCTLNITALEAYLHLNYIPSPYSIYNEVSKILPGTYLTANISGKVEMHRYFDLEYGSFKQKKDASSLESRLEDSVKKRLIADVPVGCFLSGGIDSSIITGIASRHVEKLNTYNIAFKGDRQYDESKDARIVATHFKTNHHEIEISEKDMLQSTSFLLNHVDEPFADSSAIAMYNLCKGVSGDIKVALSGDGADELFAGYYKHLAIYNAFRFPILSKASAMLNPLLAILPKSREKGIMNSFRKWHKYASASVLPPVLRYWHWAGYGNPADKLLKKSQLNPGAFLWGIHQNNLGNMDECLRMDIAMVLEGDMLVKTDRMSMLNSLEVRVPFLDHEFAEFVSKIPAGQKIEGNKNKKLLKQAFSHMLPKEILEKKKHGFEVPLKKWLNGELNSSMKSLLHADLIEEQGMFNYPAIHKLKMQVKTKQSANSEYAIWNLMIFNSWYIQNRHTFK